MSDEVAVQQLKGIDSTLRAEGGSLNELLDSADRPIIDWSDTARRLDWADYSNVLQVVLDANGDAWLAARGADSIYDSEAGLFRHGLAVGVDSPEAALHWFVAPYGPFRAVSPYIDMDVREGRQPREFVLETRMQSGLAPSRGHQAFTRGVLIHYPTLLYEAPAEVRVEQTEVGANFSIRFARPRVFAKVRRRLRRSRPLPEYLVDIGNMYLAMVHQQQALQEEQRQRRAADLVAARAEKVESLIDTSRGVAHDFNNLLTVAQNQLDLLLDDVGAEHHAEIREVMRTCARGSELVERLWDYAGEQMVAVTPLDLNSSLREMAPLLRSGLGDAGELTIDTLGESLRLSVDRNGLENALLNLVVNARDALTEAGEVRIAAATVDVDESSSEVEAGNYVRITVSDSGSGMSPEVASRAFDPYFTTKAGEGSGLGLSMVSGFARQHGGYASVETRPGQGSTFQLLLPGL